MKPNIFGIQIIKFRQKKITVIHNLSCKTWPVMSWFLEMGLMAEENFSAKIKDICQLLQSLFSGNAALYMIIQIYFQGQLGFMLLQAKVSKLRASWNWLTRKLLHAFSCSSRGTDIILGIVADPFKRPIVLNSNQT